MIKDFFKNAFFRFIGRFEDAKTAKSTLPCINESTLIREILSYYPRFGSFLQTRFGISVPDTDLELSFRQFTTQHRIAPPQVTFMEFQLHERTAVRFISAPDLKAWMDKDKGLVVLDARESWEREWGSLPGALPLDRSLLNKVLSDWPKDTPVALYCHYGVRSLDAAVYLGDCGFENVRALEGGVEAWSSLVDPDFPKYPGHPC